MSYLILVRHGQSTWNYENRFTGWIDIDLTTQGIQEAKLSGELIKKLNINFELAFSSIQIRSKKALEIILDILNKKNIKINEAWELNERNYGDLSGKNKDEIEKKYGKEQMKIWRRSWDVSPPPLSKDSSYHPLNINIYKNIPRDKILDSESLKNTYDRVISYYQKNIEPLIQDKKNVLISAHGNSLRALCKKLFNISKEKIIEFEIPTGNPLLINFEENFKIINYKYLNKQRAKKIFRNL